MQKKEPRYEDGIEYWLCPACRLWQMRKNYYKDKRTGNGLKSQCKKCHTQGGIDTRNPDNNRRLHREYMARFRKNNLEKCRERERNRPAPSPEKVIARNILNGAVKMGTLDRPKQCPECGGNDTRIDGHHPDYEKPLEVEWFCPLCHADRHRLGLDNKF